MRIINWQKLNGITYKGYVIGAPRHSPNHKVYNINIYDLNKGFSGGLSIWMTMLNMGNHFQLTLHFKEDSGQYGERTEILNYDCVKTMRNFLDCYEVLIDWYEFKKK
jgi:hypothetical protein